jgi:hypothetical protein
MKFLTPKIHGAIDYGVVVFLWLSPGIFGLSDFVSAITYVLGGIHLVLTLFTNFHFGLIKIIPFSLHGWIELMVSIILIAAPWLLRFSGNSVDRNFYVGFGIAVFVTWLTTDYKGK